MRLAELHTLLPHASRLTRSGFRAKCPAHDGKSTGSLSVREGDDGRLLLACHGGCPVSEIVAALGLTMRDLFDVQPVPTQRTPMLPPVRATAPDPERLRRQRAAADLWAEARALTSGPAIDYLLGRSCRIPPRDGDLRWHADVRVLGLTGPALVGRITRADDATGVLGLHITWLTRDGAGWRRGERRYLGGKSGGVVRLWPDEAVTYSLGVAEGVETGLSLAHVHSPVWACMDASNLAAFPVLEGIESLIIAADRDDSGAGQRAAADCAERWSDAGRDVVVLAPDVIGTDLNDEVIDARG